MSCRRPETLFDEKFDSKWDLRGLLTFEINCQNLTIPNNERIKDVLTIRSISHYAHHHYLIQNVLGDTFPSILIGTPPCPSNCYMSLISLTRKTKQLILILTWKISVNDLLEKRRSMVCDCGVSFISVNVLTSISHAVETLKDWETKCRAES